KPWPGGSSGAPGHRSSARAPSGCRRDVVVQPEEVLRVVGRLDLGEPAQVAPKGAVDPGAGKLIGEAGEVEVHAPGPEFSDLLPGGAHPGDLLGVVGRVDPVTVGR